MRHFALAITLSAFVACGTIAGAQEQPFSIGVGVTTLGPTIEGSYEITPQMSLRGIGVVSIEGEDSVTEDDTKYDYEYETGGFGVVADYYPDFGGLRLTGGLFKSNMSFGFEASASGAETIRVGDMTYTNVSVGGDMVFERDVAPLLAVGYTGMVGGWQLAGEVGALFIGGVDASFEQTGGSVTISEADLQEQEESFEDDYGIGAYPYVGVSMTFLF